MAIKLTTLTNKIATQLHLVAESYTICSSRSRWPVRKLWDTPSYINIGFCIFKRYIGTRLNKLLIILLMLFSFCSLYDAIQYSRTYFIAI